jgi:hypothetical protein
MHCKDPLLGPRYGSYLPYGSISLANSNQIGNVQSTINWPLNHNLLLKGGESIIA